MTVSLLRRFGFANLLLVLAACAHAAAPENVAYITNQGGGVTVLDLATLKPLRTLAVGTDPRGLAITPDGRYVITANQGNSDISVTDTTSSQVVRRIPVGKNVEFMRIQPDGTRIFVTYEPASSGGPPGKNNTAESDTATPAEIAVIDLAKWAVVGRMKAAPETEGIEFSPDRKSLIVANEGDNTVAVYSLATGRITKTIDVASFGSRPRGIKVMPDGRGYVVTLENSDNFLVLDPQFKVIKSVPTEKGPYGVAFDPTGKRLWIAAARADRLQVFDAQSFSPIAAIPVGKRCWHFSFLPDAERLLLACGRSNTLELVDVVNYKVVQTLEGYSKPWGIVTFPKTHGSLDAP